METYTLTALEHDIVMHTRALSILLEYKRKNYPAKYSSGDEKLVNAIPHYDFLPPSGDMHQLEK